jgi:hypothetical protein
MRRDPASKALAATAQKVQDVLVRGWLMKLANGDRAEGPPPCKKRRASTAKQPAPSR